MAVMTTSSARAHVPKGLHGFDERHRRQLSCFPLRNQGHAGAAELAATLIVLPDQIPLAGLIDQPVIELPGFQNRLGVILGRVAGRVYWFR